jgi:hypothetical protein
MIVGGLAVACAVLLGACSSSSTPTSSAAAPTHSATTHSGAPASASTAVCQHITSLRKSLESLTHTSVSPTSASTITTDLKNIQVQVTALKGMKGSGAFSAQLSQLTTAVDQVKKAASQLSSNPLTAVQSLTKELKNLKTTVQPMIAQMKAACP